MEGSNEGEWVHVGGDEVASQAAAVPLTARLERAARGPSLFSPMPQIKSNDKQAAEDESFGEYLLTLRASADGKSLPWLSQVKDEEV